MKGMIFTEFLEMVEEQFSLAMVDTIIEQASLPSGGVYTATGTYPHSEIVQLVVNLSQMTRIPASELLHAFGERLFERFSVRYAHFLGNTTSAYAFLQCLDEYVHAEVKKLYPEAELPTFTCIQEESGAMTLLYRSHRAMADLAQGLIVGCFRHFGEPIHIGREDVSGGTGTAVKFILTPSA